MTSTTSYSWTIARSLGIFDMYVDGCQYQPRYNPVIYSTSYQIPNVIVNSDLFTSTYNLCTPNNPVFNPLFTYTANSTEYTYLGIYCMFDAYREGAPTNYYLGEIVRSTESYIDFLNAHPVIVVDNAYYEFRIFASFTSKVEWIEYEKRGYNPNLPPKPCYTDLLKGYNLDSRRIPSYPIIRFDRDINFTIGYYAENSLEQVEGLRSIDWRTYRMSAKKNKPITLPIYDCVLGTLYFSDSSINSRFADLPGVSGKYQWSDLLPNAIPDLFGYWNSLVAPTSPPELPPAGALSVLTTVSTELRRIVHTIPANNNVWGNRTTLTDEVNPDPSHPMYLVNQSRANGWHLEIQNDQSIGTLIMDSPRTIEIHAALEAGRYAYDENTDPDERLPRIANLGNLIERIASLLGYRPEPDGTFNKDREKSLVRTIVDATSQVDAQSVGVNNFGDGGMIVRRLNNSFDGDKIKNDRCVIVQDLPQLLAEYQDQINLAMNLQESSAIEIKKDKETARYPNQLALLVEILNLLNANNDMTRSGLVSSLVAQGQSSEIIAGLGLPSVTKTLPIEICNKVEELPYKGISPHRSISQEIATCTHNVGIVLGQLI